MIWTLKVTCVAGPYHEGDCVRFIEIDEAASLYDLHVAIQDAVHFDDEFDFVYFHATSHGGKRAYVPEGVIPDEGVDTDLYEDLPLAEAFPTEGRRHLFYLFNLDDEWIFEIRKERGDTPPRPHEFYPLVLEDRAVGHDPMQYGNDLDDFADADEAAEHRAAHARRGPVDDDIEADDDLGVRSLFGRAGADDDEDDDEDEFGGGRDDADDDDDKDDRW